MFYEDLRKAQEVDRNINEMIMKGQEEAAQLYAQQHAAYVGQYSQLAQIAKQVGEVNKLLRMTSTDTEMTKEEKGKVEEYYRGIVNELFRNYAEQRKGVMKQMQQ